MNIQRNQNGPRPYSQFFIVCPNIVLVSFRLFDYTVELMTAISEGASPYRGGVGGGEGASPYRGGVRGGEWASSSPPMVRLDACRLHLLRIVLRLPNMCANIGVYRRTLVGVRNAINTNT